MIIAGVLLGLLIFVLSMWLNLRIMKKARSMPPQEATKYLVVRYVIKIGLLTLLMGSALYWSGMKFTLGVLGGMVFGILLFLVVSRSNRTFFEGLVKDQGKETERR